MAYKILEHNFSFADIAIQNLADKNRNHLFLNQVKNTIEWQSIQELLLKYYDTGKASRGERALRWNPKLGQLLC